MPAGADSLGAGPLSQDTHQSPKRHGHGPYDPNPASSSKAPQFFQGDAGQGQGQSQLPLLQSQSTSALQSFSSPFAAEGDGQWGGTMLQLPRIL